MCGVSTTLGSPCSSVTKPSLLVSGSSGYTSTAAPPRCLERSARASAGMSTTEPRLALIRYAPFFICASSAAPIIMLVEAASPARAG